MYADEPTVVRAMAQVAQDGSGMNNLMAVFAVWLRRRAASRSLAMCLMAQR
jgi:hypothetical protein